MEAHIMANRGTSTPTTTAPAGAQAMSSQATGSQTATIQVPKDKVAMRAYEKWCQGGYQHGCDQKHWLEAEMELRSEIMKKQARR
jgi:hypothetical protein